MGGKDNHDHKHHHHHHNHHHHDAEVTELGPDGLPPGRPMKREEVRIVMIMIMIMIKKNIIGDIIKMKVGVVAVVILLWCFAMSLFIQRWGENKIQECSSNE